jgi:hypothetical protein
MTRLWPRYASGLDTAALAHASYVIHRDAYTASEVNAAITGMLQQFEDDAVSLLDTDDVAHHQRLFLVLAVVGLASVIGLWLGVLRHQPTLPSARSEISVGFRPKCTLSSLDARKHIGFSSNLCSSGCSCFRRSRRESPLCPRFAT